MNVENHEAGHSMKPATPDHSDHFAEVGVERRYDVDKDELEARYLERSKVVHPDRFVNAEASERIGALSQSMQLNEAYRVLKNDRTRAEHLLSLHGVVIGGNEQLDPSFLMEILEAREELAEAQARGDSAEVVRLEEAMLDRKDNALDSVGVLFGDIESGLPSAPRLAEIRRELIILRYIDRYLEAALDEID